jgi:hypothetical protein
MRKVAINPPRFVARSHVKCWVSQVLKTARLVWGDGSEYHMTVKRVMEIKRAAMARFKNA